ncbi:MAG TPA: DUF3298 and DUF4163 domain-containing protein [Gemmatimonadota bacterium]
MSLGLLVSRTARLGLAGAVAAAVAQLACGGTGPPPHAARSISRGQGPALTYETRTLERFEPDCPEAGDSCGRVSLEYPEITTAPGDEVRKALNDSIAALLLEPLDDGTRAASPEGLAEEFLARNAEARLSLPEGAPSAGWFLERKVRVIHQDAEVLSLEETVFWYTGGAHPNTSARLASFDPASGRRLVLEDLLTPGYGPPLNAIAEHRFRAIRDVPDGQSLTDAGFWFEDGVFSLNDNFAVADSGLAFHFDPYEIAPYALGPTDLVLDRGELGELIRPGGPLDAGQ